MLAEAVNVGQAPWLQLVMLVIIIVVLLLTIKRPGSR